MKCCNNEMNSHQPSFCVVTHLRVLRRHKILLNDINLQFFLCKNRMRASWHALLIMISYKMWYKMLICCVEFKSWHDANLCNVHLLVYSSLCVMRHFATIICDKIQMYTNFFFATKYNRSLK